MADQSAIDTWSHLCGSPTPDCSEVSFTSRRRKREKRERGAQDMLMMMMMMMMMKRRLVEALERASKRPRSNDSR